MPVPFYKASLHSTPRALNLRPTIFLLENLKIRELIDSHKSDKRILFSLNLLSMPSSIFSSHQSVVLSVVLEILNFIFQSSDVTTGMNGDIRGRHC